VSSKQLAWLIEQLLGQGHEHSIPVGRRRIGQTGGAPPLVERVATLEGGGRLGAARLDAGPYCVATIRNGTAVESVNVYLRREANSGGTAVSKQALESAAAGGSEYLRR